MRRLNPAMSLTTALLTAVAAASPNPSLAQAQARVSGPAPVRPSPTAPEAPEAITSGAPMASARAPRHLLRNGQDYLGYGEFLRALALFREAEARIGELAPAEQQELRVGIEAARQGMRSPEAPAEAVAARRGPSRSRAEAQPGAIALAVPPAPGPGPMTSPDGVVLAGAERTEPAPPVAPEPIAIDPSVLPSAGQVAPPPPVDLPSIDPSALAIPAAPAELPPIEPAPTAPTPTAMVAPGPPAEPEAPEVPVLLDPTPPAAAPASSESAPIASEPAPIASEPTPAEAAPITLPPLPADSAAPAASWPTAALSAMAPERLQGPEAYPAPPAELPPLPPAADELMGLGSLGARPPAPVGDPATPPVAPGPGGLDELPAALAAGPAPAPIAEPTGTPAGPYRDLLSPEQRQEVMMIVRRQEEAEQRGLVPAPLGDDPLSQAYDRDELAGTGIQLPRPPSPTEIRPIQSIPVNEDFVPLPPRRFNPSRKYWAAAATCHAPLYFQDPVLERYGQSVEQKLGPIGRFLSYPLDDPTQSRQRNQIAQPFFSAGLLAAQIATWPYKVLMDTPGEAEYDLGYYRPGDLVPPDLIYAPLTGVGPPLRGKHY